MLAAGRVDAVIDASEALRHRINALHLHQLLELPPVLDTQTFNLCLQRPAAFGPAAPL